MTDEFWASIPGYEGLYEVSTLGRFRRAGSWRPVAVTISPHNGYGYIHLCKGGVAQNYRAHRLVLHAHVGLPSGTQDARHLNGNRADNRIANLAWGTAQENHADKVAHGTVRGARPGSAHHFAMTQSPCGARPIL